MLHCHGRLGSDHARLLRGFALAGKRQDAWCPPDGARSLPRTRVLGRVSQTRLAHRWRLLGNRHRGSYPAAARAFMARLTSTARITSESNACNIIETFARRLRNAVSVGLKAVLVLKARKR